MINKAQIKNVLEEYAWTENEEKCLAAVKEDGFEILYVNS